MTYIAFVFYFAMHNNYDISLTANVADSSWKLIQAQTTNIIFTYTSFTDVIFICEFYYFSCYFCLAFSFLSTGSFSSVYQTSINDCLEDSRKDY